MKQNDRILRYLRTGLELSPALAWRDLGCARLAARILDLRRQGHDIRTRMVMRADARFAVYTLNAAQQQVSPKEHVEGNWATNPPSAAAAAPLASEGAG